MRLRGALVLSSVFHCTMLTRFCTARHFFGAHAYAGDNGKIAEYSELVRARIAHEYGDECLFDFRPVFVREDHEVDHEAAAAAVSLDARDDGPAGAPPPPKPLFEIAQKALETEANLWDWQDDVEFIGLSWVDFR